MKGKKFIVIMAIFFILCSIQATTALEDTNVTQSDIQVSDIVLGVSEISVDDASSNASVQSDAADDNAGDSSDEIAVSESVVKAIAKSEILGVSNDDVLGANKPWSQWTAGTMVYGVDYDTQFADSDTVPLDRFFKSVFWGIRDYLRYYPSATKEWNVFLNNKTFTGGYGDAGVGTTQTGYNSYGSRVDYLGMTRLAGYSMDNIEVTIHLYGGSSIGDGKTSTLDLTDYGANYALLDFGSGKSSIEGINFKNFDVNKHDNTIDPETTVPFIKLGDASNPSSAPENLIKDCTFENITLNPNQPLYEVGQIKDLHFDDAYSTSSLSNLIKFIFWNVRDNVRNTAGKSGGPTLEYNVYLDNHTFDGGYGADGVGTISTGYMSWDTSGSYRAKYITFRNYNPLNYGYTSDNFNITLYIYGGNNKYDAKTSTIDLSKYAADYRFIDLSGGSSKITGVNFKNFDANKYSATQSTSTSMPFIFLGDEKIQNYQSSLINCTFENITLNQKQPLVRMAYMDSSSEIIYSGGVIDGCTFNNNHASQLIAIAGSPSDNNHRDDGPLFYGFNASNNVFTNNTGYAHYDRTNQSLGFALKLWNEVTNATLDNNRFFNNTNAVHGAAYCIIGSNITISNNYIDSNQAVYGAGIESHVGNITIKDSIFVNNVASGNHSQHSYRDGSGAAIALLGSNNYVYNCTFINNVAHGHAGAIDIVGGMHNVTQDDGSQVLEYLTANNTVIKDSRFYQNIAYDYAGGVHINGTNTRIDNCTFEDNNASFAGATRLIGENVTIVNSSFTDNNAIQGGACYIEGENAHIYDSNFTFNDATHSLPIVRGNASRIAAGGALYIIGNHTIVTNNVFTDNAATAQGNTLEGLGGALYMNGRDLTFNNDEFTDNIATQGGACYINGNDIYADVMTFTENRAVQGGAVYIRGNNTILNNGTYKKNNAIKDINPNVEINPAGGAVLIVGYNTNISDSDFDTNYAINGNGGAIAIDGHSANITSNTFNDNEAIMGGAIYIDSISTYSNIIDANFTENKAILGGAIFIMGSQTNIGEADFTNNNATHDLAFAVDGAYANYNPMGGAIGIDGNKSYIYNATFSYNTAVALTVRTSDSTFGLRSYGGAIAIQGNDTTLENTDFEFNQAIVGGAIYYRGTLNDINDTEFRNNSAIQGGALYIDKSDATFGSSRFYNNSATHDLRFDHIFDDMLTIGGAVNIPGNSIFVYDSEFINNTAYGTNLNGGLGGAIAVNGSDDHIVNSKFENNQAIQGGAFYLNGDEVYVVDSNFTENRAIQGGAGYIDGTQSFVENSNFNENYATHEGLRFDLTAELADVPTEGGAIHILGENININSSNFTKNSAVGEEDETIGGGAIYIEGNYATIEDSTFDLNTALEGGAVFIAVNHTKVIDSNFTENTADVGGAVYLENAMDSQIIGSTFTENTADVGGAVAFEEGSVDGKIIDSVFEDNNATKEGGAVFWHADDGSISGSNFTHNIAADGGAVYWNGFNGNIDKSRFIANEADFGGAVCLGGSSMEDVLNMDISNSYFENNFAYGDGGAICGNYGQDLTIDASTFVENYAYGCGGAIATSIKSGEIKNSNFTSNEAVFGGAVFATDNALTATDLNFDYNNAVQGGAVFIAGEENAISNSVFNHNNATYALPVIGNHRDELKTKGGAIYIDGQNNVIDNSKFYNNTAVATNESVSIVQDTPGILGAYLDDSNNPVNDDGLGGAIYVANANNGITSSEFDYNVARNGSAIYNDAEATYFFNDTFIKNQAWSYVLEVNTTEAKYHYGDVVKVNVYNYIAGDNILNGIYNALDVSTVTFNDVEFIIDDDVSKLRRTVKSDIHPDDGAEKEGLYQDSLERYQPIVVEIYVNDTKAPTSKGLLGAANGYTLVKNQTVLSDYMGNYTLDVTGLAPGNYSILAYHPEDRNYKYIVTQNIFEILPIVDLNVTKSVSEDLIMVGDNVIFTIVVSNAANATNATNVTVTDILPEGLELLENDTATGHYDADKNIWFIGDLANGTTVTLTLVFKTSQIGVFNNTVNASCTEDEWNYTNNNDTVAFEVACVNLTINKTAIVNKTLYVGDEILFQINVTNPSKFNATMVVVKDFIPDGLEFVSCSDPAYDDAANELTIEFLESGESYVFTITLKALTNGTFTNVANVTCAENETQKSDDAEVTVEPLVNLTIVKTVDWDDVIIGDIVVFTINVTNNGPSDATNVTVKDNLPNGLTLAAGELEHVIAVLAPGESYAFNVTAIATRLGSFTNYAYVNCSENGTVKSANATVRVFNTDIKIVKTANVTDVLVNDLVNFTISIRNHGTANATNVNISDSLIDAFEFISAGNEGKYDANTRAIVWNVGTLASEQPFTTWVVVRVITNGTFDNVAVVNCTEEPTLQDSKDTVTAKYDVQLEIVKTSDDTDYAIGDVVEFNITVTNKGLSNATDVTVKDDLPNGLTLAEGSELEQVIAVLAPGESVVITVKAIATAAGEYTNVATVTCTENDTVLSDNATIEVFAIDLKIHKIANVTDILVNELVNFTVNVKDHSNAVLTNVNITDYLDEAFEFIAAGNGGKYDSATRTVTWNVGTLAKEQSFDTWIVVRVLTNGTFDNTAHVNATEEPALHNSTATVTAVYDVQLDVVKVANDNDFAIGDIVEFNITVTNNGRSEATNVTVRDSLPEGLTLTEGELEHVIAVLAPGESVVITIYARTTAVGDYTNVVTVSCTENDTVLSDNVTISVFRTDIKINKTANVTDILVNDLVNFTIDIRNHGGAVATNVNITDYLDEAFEFIAAGNGGKYDANTRTIVWNVGTLASEQPFSTWVVVRVISNGTFDNVAHVNCSEEPTVQNATATVNAVYDVQLDVVKVADANDYGIGDVVEFNITVTNNGRSNATNVTVKDSLPEGLTLAEGSELEHVIAVLAPGESVTITIKAITTATGEYTNVVVVSCVENTTEVSDDATIPVYNPDLKIIKTANVTSVNVGDLVNFTIVVTNHGIVTANGVVISDVLDTSAFEVVDSSEGKLVWNIGSLAVNESYTVWIVVKTLAAGTFDNVASVNCTEEPTVKNSTATVSVSEIVKVPSMSVVKIALNESVYPGDMVSFLIIVTNTGDVELNGVFVNDVLPEGLVYNYFIGANWINEGTMFRYNAPLAVGESIELIIVANATKAGNFTNTVVAGSDLTDNVTASADVTVLENVTPVPPVPEEPVKPVHVPMDSKATGNPLIMLLLVIFAIIPLRRRKH